MKMFEKEKFTWDGLYLMYVDGENRSFVARFKYRKNYKSWINFLVRIGFHKKPISNLEKRWLL